MLTEKFVRWGSTFILIYAICVAAFYMVGLINARVCEALCSLPCFAVAAWYVAANVEERRAGRVYGTIISSVGWALVGIAFILPPSIWLMRLLSAGGGLCCIVVGCAIGFIRAIRQVSSPETAEDRKAATGLSCHEATAKPNGESFADKPQS